MSLLYRAGRRIGRFIFFCTMRAAVDNPQAPRRQGGFVLAVTHLSHLEPFCSSTLSRRQIDWVTRKEFFHPRPIAWLLRAIHAIRVDREGVPISTIRTAVHRLRQGRVVGIFPEGGVRTGAEAAIRGGSIRKGCCSIAIHANAPVIPCVMLGTHTLNALGPWLPFRRGRIWVAYGEPIFPPSGVKSTRMTRERLAREIAGAFRQLYTRLCERYQICDSSVP
ncbi:MAG TPA: lysophospholipid acyltransferase family protein [Tepidisphaeraceae bacterium]|jgi:1-acyl-sn-glycerol-3-phosphate acyltransferase